MKMRTINLLIALILSVSVFGQSKNITEELNKKKRELPSTQLISGQGILVSYMSMDIKGQYNYDISSGFILYDFDLNKKWKLDGLNNYSLNGQKEIMKLSGMFKPGSAAEKTRSYTLTEDGKHIFLHDFIDNEVTVINVASGTTKSVKSSLELPEETGYINYSADNSTFVVSYVTYTNKKTKTEDIDSKLYVARYTPELAEKIQEIDVKSVGSSKHKVRLISSSNVSSRKWHIMSASNKYVLLQDSYLLHDDEQDQNYRRLLSISSKGEIKELLIPFGGYDKKNERYYGKTFCNYQTNNKLYNVYIAPQPDNTGNINVQIIDLDLTLLAETSIKTSAKLSKLWSHFDIQYRAKGHSDILVREDNSLYRIKIESNYSEINHEKTDPIENDCIKNYSKYRLECYDYKNLKSDYTSLNTFVPNDEKKSNTPVNVELYKSENSIYLIKTPQVTLNLESFFEIYKFDQ